MGECVLLPPCSLGLWAGFQRQRGLRAPWRCCRPQPPSTLCLRGAAAEEAGEEMHLAFLLVPGGRLTRDWKSSGVYLITFNF